MKTLALVYVLFVSSISGAFAQCPNEAEQALHNVKISLYSGQQPDIRQVFEYAAEALNKCSDRSVVQGQAAELFALIGEAVPDLSDKHTVYSSAYQAILNNGTAWNSSVPTPIVKNPDGSEKTLYYYGTVNMLTGTVAVALAELTLNGHAHEIFDKTYTSDQKCPHLSEERTGVEVRALSDWASTNNLKVPYAIHRTKGLYTVCPDYHSKISFPLAELYLKTALMHEGNKDWAQALRFAKEAKFYAADYRNSDSGTNSWFIDWSLDLDTKIRQYSDKLASQ